MMPSPANRPAHSTRCGTPAATIHSQCTIPSRNPTASITRRVSAPSISVSDSGMSAGTTCASSTGRGPGKSCLPVTLTNNGSPPRTSISTLYSWPSTKRSASMRSSIARSGTNTPSSCATQLAQAWSTSPGSWITCVPTDACRLAGLSTMGPGRSSMNERTSAGLDARTDSGLAIPAARVTCRSSSLSRRMIAAPYPAPGRPHRSASRAANGVPYSVSGMIAAGSRPRCVW